MELGYAYLLSRGYIFRICLDNLAEACMEVVLDFRAEGLPIGMGAVMMDSKILLVGGEMVKKDITLGRVILPNVLDLEYGDKGVSSCVYEFDPLRKHSSVSITIPQMRGAKGKPKIAIIGGKIFVLGSRPHCWKFPSPAFECYNISCGGEWEELPEPPHYRDKNPSKQALAWQLSGYFVIGRKIYMRNCFGLGVFDVDTGEWKDRDRILNETTSIAVDQNGIPIPYTGDRLMAYLNEIFNSPVLPSYNRLNETTSIAVGQNGIVIAYTRDGLMAYLHEIDGTLKLEQHLYQIDDNFEDPQICRGFVFFVRDGIFCFIWSLSSSFGSPVRVTTFLVNVRDGYIEAKVMQSHKYHFNLLVPDFDCSNIENVFIVRGEEKLEDPLLADVYDHWLTRSVSGPPPEPRFAHGAAAIEDQMYILGGVQGGIYLNDLHALDMRRWTWSKVEVKASGEALKSASPVGPAPCARHSLIPIPWGVKRLLLIAGLTKDPSETIDVKQFDLESAVWSTLKTHGKPPASRGGQSVTLVGKRLVVFGGENAKGPLLNDLHILDLETLTWGEIDSTGLPPSPRSDHSAAVHADRYLFIFGGSSHTACLNDLHVLDLQTLEWSRPTEKGEIPSPRAGHAGITIGQNWFIAGGGDKRSGVSDTIVLNMSTLVWSVVTTVQSSSPLACEGLSLVLGTYRGLHMLVSFGGYKYDGQYSNEVNVLKPSYKIEPLQPQVVTEEAAFPVDCRIKPRRRWKQGSYTSSGSSSPDCT